MKTRNKDSPIVYICSPYSGDVARNTELARRYSRLAIERGCAPITPHLYLPGVLSEETERETAIRIDLRLLSACQEIWVCGTVISDGMRREIDRARSIGLPVRQIKEEEINVRD